MHRISKRQDKLTKELRAQTARIEKLAKLSTTSSKDVPPQLGQIEEAVRECRKPSLADS